MCSHDDIFKAGIPILVIGEWAYGETLSRCAFFSVRFAREQIEVQLELVQTVTSVCCKVSPTSKFLSLYGVNIQAYVHGNCCQAASP